MEETMDKAISVGNEGVVTELQINGSIKPEAVLKLMDVLDLPKGTTMTLVTRASNVIVR